MQLLEYDDKDVAEQLRTIVNYFENFRENCKDVIKTKRKDLKMKFNVQIKSNKRLYDEANIVNHFKNANSIVRDSSKKLGEICLSQARTHYVLDQKLVNSPQMFSDEIMETYVKEASPDFISENIHVPQNKFVKKLRNSMLKCKSFEKVVCQVAFNGAEDAVSLINEIKENKSKKLTFHKVKTKASNMMDNLKDLGLKKTYGASFDVQLFRILQCIRTSQEDFPRELSQSLFRCCFSLEKLSSSLLLPISAQSKAFAFCRFGQDLNSHGILMLTKACQVLVKDYENAQKSRNLLKNLEGEIDETMSANQYQLYSVTKKCFAITGICKKMANSPDYDKILSVCLEILNKTSKSCNKIDSKELDFWVKKLDEITDENLHSNVQKALNNLKSTMMRYTKFLPKTRELDDILNGKFESAVAMEAKSRFLALQTVQKKIDEFYLENKGKMFTDMR